MSDVPELLADAPGIALSSGPVYTVCNVMSDAGKGYALVPKRFSTPLGGNLGGREEGIKVEGDKKWSFALSNRMRRRFVCPALWGEIQLHQAE